MIRLVENRCELLKKICSGDVFGTRILSYFNTYGGKFDFVRVWIQLDDNENPVAAISLVEGDMTLTCCDSADFDEIKAFIDMTDYLSLQCDRSVMKKTGIKESLWGYIVEYKNIQPVNSENVSFNKDFKQMYSIIKCAGLVGVGEYLPWLSDISYRTNHGASLTAAVYNGDEMLSCASALFITENSALLGAVATKEEHRGNGFGSVLVKTLGNKMLSLGKRTMLLCKNDSITEFYKSIGFEIIGEWGLKE